MLPDAKAVRQGEVNLTLWHVANLELTPALLGLCVCEQTTAVAMFAAAVAMTMPTVEIAIFSTGRRASSP